MQSIVDEKSQGTNSIMARSGTIRMVIVYEDFDSALRAVGFLAKMTVELRSQLLITSYFWKFDALNLPELHEQAAQEAATAEMVVISTRDGPDLPANIKFWIDHWLTQKRDNSSALVEIVDENEVPGRRSPLQDYLNLKTGGRGMEFFQIGRETAAVADHLRHPGLRSHLKTQLKKLGSLLLWAPRKSGANQSRQD